MQAKAEADAKMISRVGIAIGGIGVGIGIGRYYYGRPGEQHGDDGITSLSSTHSPSSWSTRVSFVPPLPSSENENGKELLRWGLPSLTDDMKLRTNHIVSYDRWASSLPLVVGRHECFDDRRTRNPRWVMELLKPSQFKPRGAGDASRELSQFRSDNEEPIQWRVSPQEYFHSGYDRGHMAPAADFRYDQSAMNSSFLMTNISPQVGDGFNRDYWARLESMIRYHSRRYQSVHVITGPLYLPKSKKISKKKRNPSSPSPSPSPSPASSSASERKWIVEYEVIGRGSPTRLVDDSEESQPIHRGKQISSHQHYSPMIAVPTHYYKAILAENGDGNLAVAAFVIPNKGIQPKKNIETFRTSLDQIEWWSGVRMFPAAPLTPEQRSSSSIAIIDATNDTNKNISFSSSPSFCNGECKLPSLAMINRSFSNNSQASSSSPST